MGDMSREEILEAAKQVAEDAPELAQKFLKAAQEKAAAYAKRSVLINTAKEKSDELASCINSVQISRRATAVNTPEPGTPRELDLTDEEIEMAEQSMSMSFSVRPVRTRN